MAVEIGHRFSETRFVVEPGRVEEFVTALGIPPTDGYEYEVGADAPLGFLMYVTTYGADPIHEALEIDFTRAMYGGASYEVHAPVRIGDELVVRPEVTGCTRKDGRDGPLTFVEITCDYLRADGTLAVRERSTTIERG